MAQKSAQTEQVVDVEEALEGIDKLLDRVKSLFEQYFLGIQKQPPTFLHSDLERKLRDLGTIQVRNTGLRYRYATLTQKYGSYNTYWRRTLRQIENGTYVRSLSKLGRKAAKSGEEIPEEILAKMPKRMRDQVRRDREAALALARRRDHAGGEGEGDFYEEFDNSRPAQPARDARGAHLLSADDGDLDLDALFAEATAGIDEATQTTRPPIPDADEDDDFDNIATPPPPAPVMAPSPTPTPSQPAPLRAATLGFPSRAVTGPNPRVTPQPFPAVTPPKVTPPSFPPIGQPAGRVTGQNVIQRPSQPAIPAIPRPSQPGIPAIPPPPPRDLSKTDADQLVVGAKPLGRGIAPEPTPRSFAPSQGVRPNPIAPGSMSGAKPVGVETMQGPFAREPSVAVPPRRSKRDTDIDEGDDQMPASASGQIPRAMPPSPSGQTPRPQMPARPTGQQPAVPPQPTPRPMTAQATPPRPQRPGMTPTPTPTRPAGRPPPGMTDDDVHQLYQKYVKAKEMVGEQTNAQTYGKLLNTINAQAPKIMEQYKAKGVDFSVVVKDNQVIIRAKPKP